jgi:pimeloyl-ACP methyl ester carboxylesterase
VVFDFLGWGESDKPVGYDYTFENQKSDLDAVVSGLGLDRVVLVAHDASGPAVINWALEHPARVTAIVALNTFYSLLPDAPPNPPEAIRLFSDPAFERLTEHFAESPREFRWLYDFQVGGFIEHADVRKRFVPLLYRQFEARPSTLRPFLRLNQDLTPAVAADTQREPELASFSAPVRVAFGEHDRYLTPEQGRALAALFPNARAGTIPGAGHFPQLDAPAEVAQVILDASQ